MADAPPSYDEAQKCEKLPPENPNFGNPDAEGAATSHYYPQQQNPNLVQQQPLPQTASVVYVQESRFGTTPVNTTCQQCGQQIQTRVNTQPGILTYLLCFGLCIVGCDCGCCLIPFCMNECQDIEHTCPNCNSFVGSYRRI